jgi:tight adherence protein B
VTAWLPVLLGASAAAVAATSAGPGALLRVTRGADSSLLGFRPAAATVILSLLTGIVAGPAAGLLLAGALLVLQRVARAQRAAGQLARERARALDALSLLGADLRAGRTPADALAAAADVACGGSGVALAAAAAAARIGGDVAPVLQAEASAVPATLRGLAACWQVCTTAGSGLAGAVERLEIGLRAEEARRRAVAAELAGPRATAQLLAALPLAGIGLAAALGAHPLALLLHTPVGLCCLTGGLLLDGAGVLWSRRLNEAALR